MFVFVCAAMGVLLLILPWRPEWTDNHFLLGSPGLRALLSPTALFAACAAAWGCWISGSDFGKQFTSTTDHSTDGKTTLIMSESKLTSAPLAYENESFLNSPDGRVLRILSEYMEPLSRFRREQIQDTVVFFGSARFRSHADAQQNLAEQNKQSGRQLGRAKGAGFRRYGALLRGFTKTGVPADPMGGANSGSTPSFCGDHRRRTRHHGGRQSGRPGSRRKNIGLNINLPFEQNPNPYITPSLNFEFHYFFMRKFWFAYLAKALVIFPGGFGTLDEFLKSSPSRRPKSWPRKSWSSSMAVSTGNA